VIEHRGSETDVTVYAPGLLDNNVTMN